MKSIQIKYQKLILALSLFLGFFDLSILFHAPVYLTAITSTIFLFIVPGLLLSLGLNIKSENNWERLSCIVGFSLALLLFCGVVINWLLPFVRISQPLSTLPVLYSLNFLLIILLIFAAKRTGDSGCKVTFPKFSFFSLFSFIPLIFPVLAILGAISLNNHGTAFFTASMIMGIALYVLALIYYRNRVGSHTYPVALYFISLAILLMTSLRGWFITGHDIQEEYYVFQLTKAHYFWNINTLKDAYNACLSITILPTILSDFLKIPDAYIYKVIFQLLFSFCPIVIYLFLSKYTTRMIAFLATFYFLSFPTFVNDMTMLNRQEIGFLFFSLILLSLFHQHLPKRQKSILFYIFAVGMIFSHYSTTYITIALFLCVYAAMKILQIPLVAKNTAKIIPGMFRRKYITMSSQKTYLSLLMVVSLFALTFFWNSLLTNTSNGLTQVISDSIKNITTVFKQDNKSSAAAYSLFFHASTDPAQFVKKYIKDSVTKANALHVTDFYPTAAFKTYRPQILTNDILPFTPLGNMLKNIHLNVYAVNYLLRQSAAKFIQLLIIIGFIGFLFYRTKPVDREFIFACVVSLFFIFLMVIIPELSQSYGLLRLFQQSLIFLGLPIIIGSLFLFRFMKKTGALYASGILAVMFFLNLTGFFSQATGGYYPQLNLNNSGIYYDAYYMNKAEISSIHWLSSVVTEQSTIQADSLEVNKLFSFGNIYTLNAILPQTIRKSSYVYVNSLNMKGKMIISVDDSIVLNFPITFLQNNKDLIYSNGGTQIYK